MLRIRSFSLLCRLTTCVALLPVLAAALLVSCGDGNDGKSDDAARRPFEVAITSSDLAVGKQRFAFVALKDDVPITQETMHLRFFKIPPSGEPQLVGEGPIPWSPLGIKSTEGHDGGSHQETEITGVYYANVEFDEPGTWGLGVSRGQQADPSKEVRVQFTVKPATQAPAIGARAVPVKNATLKDAPLKQIDTSPAPDPAFHQLTIAEAIASGKPSIIAFATPSFCTSRACGPAMEGVTAAWKRFGDRVNVVHVEPYQLTADGQLVLKDGQRVNAEAGDAWRLPTEPWVFVVDSRGVVAARFDGPFALEELTFVLGQLAGA